jgi:hypothetical protein
MTPSPAWFDSKNAETLDAVRNGDGSHRGETQALSDYLSGSIPKQEAARRITAPILTETNPPQETYRLWGLLCDALVELETKDRHMTLDLLSEILALPSASDIQWARLPGFASMWDDLYRLHLHGQDPWEKSGAPNKDEVQERRDRFEAIGRTEAEMFVRGFDAVVHEYWGYQVIDLVCSDRPGLDILMSEVIGWLDVAGWKLKEKLGSGEKIRFHGCQTKHPGVDRPLAEHWVIWKESMLELSQEDSRLTEVGRGLATRCLELM